MLLLNDWKVYIRSYILMRFKIWRGRTWIY